LLSVTQCQDNAPAENNDPNLVVNTFTESQKAFPNPLKGFIGPATSPYITMNRQYVRWNEIETKESDGVDVIRAYSDRVFTPFAEKGIKVIPRVYLCWPYNEQMRKEPGWYSGIVIKIVTVMSSGLRI